MVFFQVGEKKYVRCTFLFDRIESGVRSGFTVNTNENYYQFDVVLILLRAEFV